MLTAKLTNRKYAGVEGIHRAIDTTTAVDITPTIFPDGTSQVWKLDLSVLDVGTKIDVTWKYESENELIYLQQFKFLLTHLGHRINNLYIPYLPYARQDKRVENESCFAKAWFNRIIDDLDISGSVYVLDVHSQEYNKPFYKNELPTQHIQTTLKLLGDKQCIVFPDHGAAKRYKDIIPQNLDYVVMDKVRDQSSGKITGMVVSHAMSIGENIDSFGEWKNFLIIDDICDGGATFKMAAEGLKKYNPTNISLYVTHGIFSKGIQCLNDANITKIFTTSSLTEFREARNRNNDIIIVD